MKKKRKHKAIKKRLRIEAICRKGNTILLPCNHIDLTRLVDGTGICGHDAKKCVIVREVRRVWR